MEDNYGGGGRGGILLLFVLGVLGIMGYGMYSYVQTFQNAADQALSPINDLSTQAAQLFNPTPTVVPDPVTIVHSVQALARLETIQYSIEKVITAEIGQETFGFLFGDRLLFVAHGSVIAGVDLTKLGEDDIAIEGDTLYIRVPKAEVFLATLDNDKSYVYDRETGIFTHGDVNLETTARQAAQAEIEKAALEDGILEQAQANAETFLYRLLRQLGYETVIFLPPDL
jgi:hypothetical protein